MQETATLPVDIHTDAAGVLRGRLTKLLLALSLGFLWFILCRHLSNEWSVNEQYSYGWFVPFFAAFLFWLRWEERPRGAGGDELSVIGYSASKPRENRRSPFNKQQITINTAVFLLLAALLPLRVFEIGNPDWRPLGWLHAAIVVGLTLFILERLCGAPWVRHFAFPVAFIFVAVPWITPIEGPIVQGLMRLVAGIAAETLALFGVPAQLEGNVIRISSGVVGVNEACSGVRSLQTSLMIGLLFGELKRLSIGRRLALVAAAVAIAFVANCGRAFFLVWIAARDGIEAVAKWHDLAGYAIVGAVFLGTVALAGKLGSRKEKGESLDRSPPTNNNEQLTNTPARPAPSPPPIRTPQSAIRNSLPTFSFLLSTFLYLLLVEAGAEAWYRTHERNLVATASWSVRWPEDAPGFRTVPISDEVKAMLRYDSGREAMWPVAPNDTSAQAEPTGAEGMTSMFFFRWQPGATNILRARAHRPDICLPSTGWAMTADHGVRAYELADGAAALPFRHFTFAHPLDENHSLTAHAFFCEHEDRIPPNASERFDFTASAVS